MEVFFIFISTACAAVTAFATAMLFKMEKEKTNPSVYVTRRATEQGKEGLCVEITLLNRLDMPITIGVIRGENCTLEHKKSAITEQVVLGTPIAPKETKIFNVKMFSEHGTPELCSVKLQKHQALTGFFNIVVTRHDKIEELMPRWKRVLQSLRKQRQ